MEIKKAGSQPSAKGPSDWFTGRVRIDPLFQAPDPAFVQGASVTFEPGARTAWHTHPLGQTLIVTAGCGRAQHWGGPLEEIRPGDVVWFAPGEKHWHGAAPATAMTHIAVQEKKDGRVVDWMEQVSDEQYNQKQGARMSPNKDSLANSLSHSSEINITVTGRKSGRAISNPVWFVFENDKLFLVPVKGSETQWYKNVLNTPSIRVEAHGSEATFNAVPITDTGQVSSVVEKFRAKYGPDDVKKYYSKFDVALLAEAR